MYYVRNKGVKCMYNIKTKDQLVNEFIANVDANLEIVKACHVIYLNGNT